MIMRTSVWLLLVAAATWAGCGSSDAPGANDGAVGIPAGTPSKARPAPRLAKPDPPIDLEILYETEPAPGAPARVVLGYTSDIDLLDCRLSVRLPDGVTLAEGAATWRGSIARGQKMTHRMAVRLPDTRRRELIVTVTGDVGGGTRVVRSASVVFHPDTTLKKTDSPLGVRKTNSRGEVIQDLPAGELRRKD
jgi:hypothetical protein